MRDSLEGRHVVVTGGTGALGTAVVEAMLDRGARCHVPWIMASELEAFPFRGDERVQLVETDAQREEDVAKFYDALPPLWASIHVVGGFAMAPIAETSAADFESMWRLNTLSCFLCCREAIKKMRSSDGAGGGRIVNVSARPAVQPTGGLIAYATSKAGVASLTQGLAEELKDEGILVNAALPSVMDTPANRKAMPDADHDSWPKPEQVAEAIAFLVSPGNKLTSGSLLPVYGRA